MSFVREIYCRIVNSSLKDVESIPDVDEWMRFLDRLDQPNDAIDASFNKYLCRMWYISTPKAVVLNIASALRLLLSMPRLVKRPPSFSAAEEDKLVIIERNDVPLDDVLPSELVDRFASVVVRKAPSASIGALDDKSRTVFQACFRRHPLSFYYLLYILKELSLHSKILLDDNPKAVAVYVNERNIASPLLRSLYEEGGRELDSFMHGEYLLQLIQAYMAFSNMYVWDESYKELFGRILRCDCGRYIVYTPEKLRKKWNLDIIEPTHYLTYYLSDETEDSIPKIAEAFSILEAKGKRCVLRPHPRFMVHKMAIERCFRDDQIEDPHEVTIRDSLALTKYAAGLQSTVLFEALAEGREVVLDDYSNPKAYISLRDRKSRLLQGNYLTLSGIMSRE